MFLLPQKHTSTTQIHGNSAEKSGKQKNLRYTLKSYATLSTRQWYVELLRERTCSYRGCSLSLMVLMNRYLHLSAFLRRFLWFRPTEHNHYRWRLNISKSGKENSFIVSSSMSRPSLICGSSPSEPFPERYCVRTTLNSFGSQNEFIWVEN